MRTFPFMIERDGLRFRSTITSMPRFNNSRLGGSPAWLFAFNTSMGTSSLSSRSSSALKDSVTSAPGLYDSKTMSFIFWTTRLVLARIENRPERAALVAGWFAALAAVALVGDAGKRPLD